MRVRNRALAALLAVGVIGLSGCNQAGDVSGQARTASPLAPTHQDFGDYEVHYNAVRTDELTPAIARAYGIERSRNRVMLNVAMLAKAGDGSTRPVDGKVTATVYNLNGQLKDLEVRRISEGDALYFIGEVGISGEEILVFNIVAVPRGGDNSYSVQLRREFSTD